jgi:hypothetical protein
MINAYIIQIAILACTAMINQDVLSIKIWERDVHHMRLVDDMDCATLKLLFQLMAFVEKLGLKVKVPKFIH